MKPADIFFTTASDVVSEAIKFRTWSPWSHVALIVSWPQVISADADGVTRRDVRANELKKYAILTCSSLTDVQRLAIVDSALTQVGKGYDYAGLGSFLVNKDLNDEDRWFCSELVFWAYQQHGVMLQRRVDKAFINPGHIWISPLLELVRKEIL